MGYALTELLCEVCIYSIFWLWVAHPTVPILAIDNIEDDWVLLLIYYFPSFSFLYSTLNFISTIPAFSP